MACELFPSTQLQMNDSNVNVCGAVEAPKVQAEVNGIQEYRTYFNKMQAN